MSEIRSQATPARDELAEDIDAHYVTYWEMSRPLSTMCKCGWINKAGEGHTKHRADALLAAGWSKPRTVNSATELHTLPVESVVRNANGWIGEISIVSGKPVIFWIGNECEDELKDITLPATVLFTPGDAG